MTLLVGAGGVSNYDAATMSLSVLESADFELLWARFRETIARPLSSPLAIERIVVPGRGWESFFNRRLAEERGCWAQFSFVPFGNWLAHAFESVLGAQLAPNRELDSLTWAVARRLPLMSSDPDFREVANYIYPSSQQLDVQRLIELSRAIGRLLDRYLLERPALIDGWKFGRVWPYSNAETQQPEPIPTAARWQQKLWNHIAQEFHYRPVQAMCADVERFLHDPMRPRDERVQVWLAGGVSPSQLRFLEAVGRHLDVWVFVLVPATEFWGDLENRRALLRKRRQTEVSLREFCRVENIAFLHPLLASCGEASRQQQMLLADCQDEPWHFEDAESVRLAPVLDGSAHLPLTPAPTPRSTGARGDWNDDDDDESQTLLQLLQQDLRQAIDPAQREWPRDDSLSIHSCHTAMREVEVLRDQLQAALDADLTLMPEDIAVLCADLETYAPLVQAVFGADIANDAGRIPFQIAGRSPRRTRPIFECYFRLLAVFQGRFALSEVIDLLHVAPIGTKAGFDTDAVGEVAQWAIDAGVRWGLDAAQRQAEGLPDTDLNTWDFGLSRLVLGYAMPPGSNGFVGNVVSLDRAAGLSGHVLGRLWEFVQRLRQWHERLASVHAIAKWRDSLVELATEFLDPTVDEGGFQRLLQSIADFVERTQRNGFDLPVSFAVVAREVEREIEESATGNPFRIGGVTFTDLASLRSLPYRVIALLGMNDGDYPRRERPMRFDLIAHRPQIGDRNARLEDRHLFLEALLAARDRLIITYQGQGIRDQKLRPASVLVEELLSVLEDQQPSNDASSLGGIKDWIVTLHPLQSFSPKYFDGLNEKLFSYDARALQAAERIAHAKQPLPIFADRALPEVADDDELSLDELRLVLIAPWQLFLQRLKVQLGSTTEGINDREPLMLDALEEWHVGDQWLKARLQGIAVDELTRRFQRSGLLPAGPLGTAWVKRFVSVTENLLKRAQREGFPDRPEPRPTAARRVQYSNLRTKHVLDLWFEHLVTTVTENRTLERTVLIARDQTFLMNSLSPTEARDELDKLRRLGRIAQRWPLPFFPECIDSKLLNSQWNFDDGTFLDKLRRSADAALYGYRNNLSSNEAFQIAFRGQSPLRISCLEVAPFVSHGDELLFMHLAEDLLTRVAQQVVRKAGSP